MKREHSIAGMSILLALLPTGSVVYMGGLCYPTHSSSIVCMGLVILFIGLYAACFVRTDRFRFALPDLFAGIVAIVAAGCYLKYPGLLSLGSLCLPVLYAGIRRVGKIYPFFLLCGTAITLVLLSLYGYLQYFRLLPSHSSYFPVTGPYHNPAVYAGVMAILQSVLVPYLGVAFRCRQRKGTVRGIIAAVLLAVPVLLLTEARAAWVALGVSVAYTFFYAYRYTCASFFRKYRRAILCAAPVILLSGGLVCYQLKPHSADGRLLIWKVSLRMIKEKPLTGFGINGFPANYMFYQARYLAAEGTAYERYLAGDTHLAFNEPVRIMVEYGLGGILFYLLFVGWLLTFPAKWNVVSHTARTVLLTMLVWGLFAYPFRVFPVMVFYRCIGLSCQSVQTLASVSLLLFPGVCGFSLFRECIAGVSWCFYHASLLPVAGFGTPTCRRRARARYTPSAHERRACLRVYLLPASGQAKTRQAAERTAGCIHSYASFSGGFCLERRCPPAAQGIRGSGGGL
jgi:O-antigen ligase